ncbi:hypothetical protein DFJ73DRAFT_841952 [Zopfochytrium polystomum]|nr:hypothetical protein DFJ73DRAFT_841952 [Zopfochytrium polystomum]
MQAASLPQQPQHPPPQSSSPQSTAPTPTGGKAPPGEAADLGSSPFNPPSALTIHSSTNAAWEESSRSAGLMKRKRSDSAVADHLSATMKQELSDDDLDMESHDDEGGGSEFSGIPAQKRSYIESRKRKRQGSPSLTKKRQAGSSTQSGLKTRRNTEYGNSFESTPTTLQQEEPWVPKGNGVPLGDIPHISNEIDHRGYGDETVRKLYNLLFDDGVPSPLLKLFCGFNLDDEEEMTTKRERLTQFSLSQLRNLGDFLKVGREGSKAVLSARIWEFLAVPIPLFDMRLRSRNPSGRSSLSSSTLRQRAQPSDDALTRERSSRTSNTAPQPESSRPTGSLAELSREEARNSDSEAQSHTAAYTSENAAPQPTQAVLPPVFSPSASSSPVPTLSTSTSAPGTPPSTPPRSSVVTVLIPRHEPAQTAESGTVGESRSSARDDPEPLVIGLEDTTMRSSKGAADTYGPRQPSDAEILYQIKWILATSRPADLTNNLVRAKLESYFHTSLRNRMSFIRACIDFLIAY